MHPSRQTIDSFVPDNKGTTPWSSLTVEQLKTYLKKWQLPVSGRKAELIKRLEEYQASHPDQNTSINLSVAKDAEAKSKSKSSSNKVPKWGNSKAKALLIKCLMDDKSPIHAMAPAEIYNMTPDFKLYPFENFSSNLMNLQQAVKERKKIIKQEEEEYNKQQLAFPRGKKTSRGEPYWDTHPANLLLQEDVRSGVVDELDPAQLYASRAEYQAFKLKTFRQHIYQEKRSQRDKNYWVKLRNEEGMRKYNKEVKALKEELDTQYLNEKVEEINDMFEGLRLNLNEKNECNNNLE